MKKESKKNKLIKMPVKHWTKTSDLIRVNNYLTDCVTKGNAFVRDCDKTATGCKLTVINPHDNGIYIVDCDKQNRIKKNNCFLEVFYEKIC